MFDFLKPKAKVYVEKGRYGTETWGFEQGVIVSKGQFLFITGWLTGGARGECESWCDKNGYSYEHVQENS